MSTIDLTQHQYLLVEIAEADRTRRFHEAEAAKHRRIRDEGRERLARIMGMHEMGMIDGKEVVKRTTTAQFAYAQFEKLYPEIAAEYKVPKLEYVLNMDKLRADLPQLVAEMSTVRWTIDTEVLG